MNRPNWVRQEAPRLRRSLRKVLGEILPPAPLAPRVHRVEERLGFIIEQVSFNSGKGLRIPALFLRPDSRRPSPAILYCHNHSHDYAWGKGEILEGKGRMRPIGPILARAGYCVLAIDSWCFGERLADEMAIAKLFLLEGRSLWGMMLADEMAALNYLETRREVDRKRIGGFGFSMGATKIWWLAALDSRIQVAVVACGLTSMRSLITAGALNQHGIYYYVPGILRIADAGDIVSLIAPRPFLSLNGEEDPKAPLPGLAQAHREAGRIYKLFGARRKLVKNLYPAGHEFTDPMLRDTMGWLERHLQPTAFISP